MQSIKLSFLLVSIAYFVIWGTAVYGQERLVERREGTPEKLRDLKVAAGETDSETFVFCTDCKKITVDIKVKHDPTRPVVITFTAEPCCDAEEKPKCKWDQNGWVQFVKEAGWEYDNASPRGSKVIGDELPENTPAESTVEDLDGGELVIEHDIWYGTQPKTPRDKIQDYPGTGQEEVDHGPNKGAFRKQFVTRYVCRNKDKKTGEWEDGMHSFELKWTIYQHWGDEWTKVTLSGSKPTSLKKASDDCPK